MEFIKNLENTISKKIQEVNFLSFLSHRLREDRVDDRNQISEQKSREHTSHNGKLAFNYFDESLMERKRFLSKNEEMSKSSLGIVN